MYIKIKHIKQFLLISACVFFAGFNYFTYVKADDTTSSDQKICDKSIDSDCDGLTNTEEKLYGTDLNNPDTDGDGYSDGVEVESGYDPTIPAPNDRLATSTLPLDPSHDSLPQTSNPSLTDDLTTNLKSFVDSKGSTPISNSDINDFVATDLADKSGTPITLDTLPAVDTSKIKILDQTYSSLSADDKKKQLQADAEKYFIQVAYLVISSSPKPIFSVADLTSVKDDFVSNLTSFASGTTNQAYFLDLANRVELVMPQLLNIEVPQTFAESHVKIIRIAMGFLALRDMLPNVDSDPVSKMVLLTKVQELTPMLADFFQTDLVNYTKQLDQ